MQIQDYSTGADIELRTVFNMLSSNDFLEDIASKQDKFLFNNKYYNMISALCLKYYDVYKKSPTITEFTAIFENGVTNKQISAEDASEIRTIINSFSNQPPIANVDFELTETYKYFNAQTLKLASSEVTDLLDKGEIDKAKTLISSIEGFERIEFNGEDMYDMTDEQYEDVMSVTVEPIITHSGALGVVMNDTLVRGALVTYIGRPKVGKSWFLMNDARVARNEGKRVIYISAGDMSKEQVIKRILQADAKTTCEERYLDNQYIPCYDCLKNQQGTCFEREGDGSLLNGFNELDPKPLITDSAYKPCANYKCSNFKPAISFYHKHTPILTAQMACKLRQAFKQKEGMGKLIVEYAPAGTLTINKRRALISAICKKQKWLNADGKPELDLIVVDYATNLAKEDRDPREAIHKIWQSLKNDADMYNALVLTAFHTNATGFDFEDLSLSSFSGDNRIWNEVYGAFAINQTPDERKENIWRVSALLKRYSDYDERKQAKCYGCLATGRPHIVSQIEWREPPKPKPRK